MENEKAVWFNPGKEEWLIPKSRLDVEKWYEAAGVTVNMYSPLRMELLRAICVYFKSGELQKFMEDIEFWDAQEKKFHEMEDKGEILTLEQTQEDLKEWKKGREGSYGK